MSTRRSVSHSRSAGGVSGGVGFGGTRQPSPALASVPHRLPRRLVQIEQRLSVVGHERIEIDQLRDAVPRAVGDAGRDHAAIAVADQRDVAQILVLDDVENVLDVGFEIDRRIGQMLALAETGVARRDQAMPGRAISGCIFFHAHPADHAPWQTRKVAPMISSLGICGNV